MTSIANNDLQPRSTLGVYQDHMRIDSPEISQLTKYGSASVLNAAVNSQCIASEPATAIASPLSIQYRRRNLKQELAKKLNAVPYADQLVNYALSKTSDY